MTYRTMLVAALVALVGGWSVPAGAQTNTWTHFIETAPQATTPLGPNDLLAVIQDGVTKSFAGTGGGIGMLTNASNASVPAAPNNLLGNTVAHTYFAKAYGSCPWTQDGLGDNSPCILSAIAAAKLNVISSGGFTYGGAEVVLPEGGPYGLTNSILQNGSVAIRLVGAGGEGSNGYCKTSLKWNGANTGKMVVFGDNTTTAIHGGGIEGICLQGNTTTVGTGAAYGIYGRSQSGGIFKDFFVYNVNTAGIDIAPSTLDISGYAFNRFTLGKVSLDSAGAINAHGVVWGGTANNDVHNTVFDQVSVQYQNGDGWRCGNSDTNWVRSSNAQPIGGGNGPSIRMMGGVGPFNLSECRENTFEGWFGNGTAGTAITAEAGPVQAQVTASQSGTVVTVSAVTSGTLVSGQTLAGSTFAKPVRITSFGTGVGGTGTYNVNISQTAAGGTVFASYPSFQNYVRLDGLGSAIPLPTVASQATLCYDTDRGEHFCNAAGATTFIHGGMAYKPTGTNGAVFDIDTANSTNFATAAKFGPSLPMYLHYASPTLGFNAYWNASAWNFGKGSSANYAGTLGFSATTGTYTWATSNATGNADAVATMANVATLDRAGNYALTGHITLENTEQIQSKDSGGVVRALLSMFSDNKTYLDGGASGLVARTNNSAATAYTLDAGASKILFQTGAAAGIPVHVGTAQTTAPALTSCGTGSPAIVGTDEAGEVTLGTNATGCVITFNQAYVGAPFCVVTWQATPLASQSYVLSNAAITLTQTSTSGNKANYLCRARAGG